MVEVTRSLDIIRRNKPAEAVQEETRFQYPHKTAFTRVKECRVDGRNPFGEDLWFDIEREFVNLEHAIRERNKVGNNDVDLIKARRDVDMLVLEEIGDKGEAFAIEAADFYEKICYTDLGGYIGAERLGREMLMGYERWLRKNATDPKYRADKKRNVGLQKYAKWGV